MPQVYHVVWPMLYLVHIFILANHKMHHIIIPITGQSSNPEYRRSALVLFDNMISISMVKFLKHIASVLWRQDTWVVTRGIFSL